MLDRIAFNLVSKLQESDLFWKATKLKPDLIFLLKDTEIARDGDGISIWNRTAKATKKRLFYDDLTNQALEKQDFRKKIAEKLKQKYWHYPAGQKYSNEDLIQDVNEVEVDDPIGGFAEFFGDGFNLLDLGCGGGESAIGFAKEFPALEVVAVDHAFGHEIPLRTTRLKNLTFEEGDWNNLRYPDASFDRFLSDEGIGRYGHPAQSAREMTRVAKKGAIFRGTIGKQVSGRMGFHDALCELGWDVYRQSNVIIAVYKGAEFKSIAS